MTHPRDVLLGAQAIAGLLPVCDHYSGVEARMRKSLQLQAEMAEEFGACVFDVTLDCEDGAPVGGEKDQANRVLALVLIAQAATNLIASQAMNTLATMQKSIQLAHILPGRAGWELRFVIQGGLRILDKIKDLNYAMLENRPKLSKFDFVVIAWRTLWM